MVTGLTDSSAREDKDDSIVIDRPDESCILTVNGGSSSLKMALFDGRPTPSSQPERLISARIERIGSPDARAVLIRPGENDRETWSVQAPDLRSAADVLIDWLEKHVGSRALAAVGHRIVHGGPKYWRPTAITADLIAELRRISPLDVDHLPDEIALIERFQEWLPGATQVACFDTGFHHDMPRVAQIVPIPRRFEALGVRRYGFHGLSYAYLMTELERMVGPRAAAGRVILAHLGSGASMAAVHNNQCVDTTMGLTPASGLVMSTRCGDIDPGLPFILAQSSNLSAEQFHSLTNHESGLLGVSETSADIRDLLAHEAKDIRAAEAVDLFCYQSRKTIGALAAALGGLDILVFSGGIGEHSIEARTRICASLDFLGIALDPACNQAGGPMIGAAESRVLVLVIPTDEEIVIARDVASHLATAPTL